MTVESIKKTVSDYRSIIETLGPVVKQYFENNYPDWKNFTGWEWDISEDGEKIIMNYSYEDRYGYYEHDTETVPLECILKVIKSE